MLQEDATVMFGLDTRFPLADVEKISARLIATGKLTPGFVATIAGLLTVSAMLWVR